MSKKFVIGNWKMQLNAAESARLASAVMGGLGKSAPGVEVVLCPSYPALSAVRSALRGSRVALGAQDVFWESAGAFTGEVGASQLKEIGARYVIVGHSERRLLHETDAEINKKLRAVLTIGLTPILCVGETAAERAAGRRNQILRRQVSLALRGQKLAGKKLLIAYEPVWAIGTGKVCAASEAAKAHLFIRSVAQKAASLYTLYGGSIEPKNIGGFARLDEVDGVLAGGASLDAEKFLSLVKAFDREY
ncbi:triose-phosphate isomerase [Patescibacteria group bacterium]|nr:MAG: triose-phosphate isomerase [Patescibacteria group bacterium]